MGGFSTVGAAPPAPLTFERYADVAIAASASYTPAVKGLFLPNYTIASDQYWPIDAEIYSAGGAVWLKSRSYHSLASYMGAGMVIGDGANLRFLNTTANAGRLVLMRMGY
ncbi:MAG: hypothetical protein QXT64_07975 [Desulfurococcaceae archaeon]